MIGEPARICVGKNCNIVRLLGYNSHICNVPNINAVSKPNRWPSCEQLINKAGNLERHLTTCKERVRHILSKKCINSVKHCSTNLTRLLSFVQITKNSLATWPTLTSNQTVWETKSWKIPKQQHGLRNTFQFLYQIRPTWYKNPFSLQSQSP